MSHRPRSSPLKPRVDGQPGGAGSGASASPWTTDTVNEAAREERSERLKKLLEKLEKKSKEPASALADEAAETRPAKAHPLPTSHSSTLSSAARAAEAHAAAQRAGEAAARAKKKLLSTTVGGQPARPSSQRSATMTGAGSSGSLPAYASEGDEAAQAYKQSLLESRGRRTAAAQAAHGAAAIERGASVHARADSGEVGLLGDSGSHPPPPRPYLPSGSPNFAVAAAGSMEERAALRAARHQQIAAQRQAAEEAKAAAAAEQLRLEAEAIEAAKRAEAHRKRELVRVQREAAQAKMRAAELDSQKALLAAMHQERATLIYFGWAPWRRLVEAAHMRAHAMQRHAAARALVRFFRRWTAGVAVCRQQRLERDRRKEDKAVRWRKRRVLKATMRQWLRSVVRRRQDCERKAQYHARQSLRRALLAWTRQAREMRARREQRWERLEPRVRAHAAASLQRHFFTAWRRFQAEGRARRLLEKKKQSTKERVGGWLDEMRAKRERERAATRIDGEGDMATMDFSRLALEISGASSTITSSIPSPSPYIPTSSSSSSSAAAASYFPTTSSSSSSRAGPLSPSSFSTSSRSSAAAATILALAAPLTPSRYSALNHPSASPRAAGTAAAATVAAAPSIAPSTRSTAAYDQFIESLSPRSARSNAPTATSTAGTFSAAGPSTAASSARPSVHIPSSSSASSSSSSSSSAYSTYSALNSPKYAALLVESRESEPRAAAPLSPLSPGSAFSPMTNASRYANVASASAPAPAPVKAAEVKPPSYKYFPNSETFATTTATTPGAASHASRPTSAVVSEPKRSPPPSGHRERPVSAVAPARKQASLSATATGPVAPLSGSNSSHLSSTIPVPLAHRRVTFDSGVTSARKKPHTELAAMTTTTTTTSAGALRPTSAKLASSPPVSSNLSLIAAARAKALELDSMDGTLGTSHASSAFYPLPGAKEMPKEMLRAVDGRKAARPYEESFDDEDEEEDSFAGPNAFDRQLEMVLTKSYTGVEKKMRPTSSPIKRNGHGGSAGAAAAAAPSHYDGMDSSRSDLSTVSDASSIVSGTWSRQHANPSVALAAARAVRREQSSRQ